MIGEIDVVRGGRGELRHVHGQALRGIAMAVNSSERASEKLFRHGMSHDQKLQGTQQSSQLLPTAEMDESGKFGWANRWSAGFQNTLDWIHGTQGAPNRIGNKSAHDVSHCKTIEYFAPRGVCARCLGRCAESWRTVEGSGDCKSDEENCASPKPKRDLDADGRLAGVDARAQVVLWNDGLGVGELQHLRKATGGAGFQDPQRVM
jgi:hypothetical protein